MSSISDRQCQSAHMHCVVVGAFVSLWGCLKLHFVSSCIIWNPNQGCWNLIGSRNDSLWTNSRLWWITLKESGCSSRHLMSASHVDQYSQNMSSQDQIFPEFHSRLVNLPIIDKATNRSSIDKPTVYSMSECSPNQCSGPVFRFEWNSQLLLHLNTDNHIRAGSKMNPKNLMVQAWTI